MTKRLLGSALLLLGGALHSSLAFDGYGPSELVEMFFLNGMASAGIAVAIAFRSGWVAPVAGIAVSSASLFAFVLSRLGDGVLGFRGSGLDPAPEALLILVVEISAVLLLSLVAVERRDAITHTWRTASGRLGS